MKVGGSDPNFIKKNRVGGAGESNKPLKTGTSSTSGSESAAAKSGAEKIAVSDLGKEIAKIHEEIKNTPEIRPEKVQELKGKIEDGTYYVNSNDIAGKIIEDILKQG
ncbi:MAG: flagellar biosynthesis anti-sigma factor FlgM [Nitrospinota bacterium]